MSQSIESHSDQSNEEGPDFYQVEEILNKKETIAGTLYLIKWKDYPNPQDYTWQPLQHLKSVVHLVQQFQQKRDSLKKKIKKQSRERVFKCAKNKDQSISINQSAQNRREQVNEQQSIEEEAGKKKEKKEKKENGKYMPKVIQIHAKKKSRDDKKYWNNPTKQSVIQKEKDEASKYLVPVVSDKSRADSSIVQESASKQQRNYWFNAAPYKLGSIFTHAIEDGKLFYWFNVVTQQGDLCSLARLSQDQTKTMCKQRQAKYLMELLAKCQQQMSKTASHQSFQQSWTQPN